jgi:hypothetical protein
VKWQGKLKKNSVRCLSFSNIEGSDTDSTLTSGGVMGNNELEKIWKETFVIFFNLLSPCLLGKAPNLACELVEIQDSFTSQIQIRSFYCYLYFNNV